MLSPPDIVDKGIMLSRRPLVQFVRPVRYCYQYMNDLNKTGREYSLDPTDDLIRFWRPKVKVTVGQNMWCQHVIHVEAWRLSNTLLWN